MCTNTHHTTVTILSNTTPHYALHHVTPHPNSTPYPPHPTLHATHTPHQPSNNFYTILYSYKYCIKQSWCKQCQMEKRCTSRREYRLLSEAIWTFWLESCNITIRTKEELAAERARWYEMYWYD
jgi:hypothetical protein